MARPVYIDGCIAVGFGTPDELVLLEDLAENHRRSLGRIFAQFLDL